MAALTNRANVKSARRRYRLHCALKALGDELSASLKQQGWHVEEAADLTLVIDGPWGVALQALANDTAENTVVVTDNPCPEYWEDLRELQPRVLLVGGHNIPEVAEALERAQAGEHFQRLPCHDSPLTCTERMLLRYSAMGWENKRIAREFNLTEGTVKNGLNRVFHKLDFDNRTQLALYYWGLWHLLETRPMHCHRSI